MPTFIVFQNGQIRKTIQGADVPALQNTFQEISAQAGAGSSGAQSWIAVAPTRLFQDVTTDIDPRGLDMLNASKECGSARSLFDASKPLALQNQSTPSPDWVESDTDEQLMLFIPFKTTLKIHSLQITSVSAPESDSDKAMRPQTLHLYINQPNVLGFDEAESVEPTQSIELDSEQWDNASSTASVELRFVKFQRVHSLVLFVAAGQRQDAVQHAERVRIDRIRIVGDSGEKHELGKLEKIEH